MERQVFMSGRIRDKGVIFDMDGVLVDTAAFHKQAWYDLAGREGWQMKDEFFAATFGMKNEMIIPLLVGSALAEGQLDELSGWKEQRYRELIEGKVEMLAGVGELVRQLKNGGFALAVGSSAPRVNIELIMRSVDIGEAFEVIISSEDTSKSKPDPDTFLKAAAGLELKPECCVVIEDAVAGVEAGKAGGMAVVAVTNTCTREALGRADKIVDSLAELQADDFDALLSNR